MFGTAALNALYECAIHVIAKHYITATPWAALMQNHIGSLFWVENKRQLEKNIRRTVKSSFLVCCTGLVCAG